MYFLAIIMSIGLSIRIIILEVCYFQSYATCLDYHTAPGGSFSSYPLYEYELTEAGEKVVYRNWGDAVGYPKKGKKYKVLIHKNNHNKICAKNELTVCIVLLCIPVLFFLSQFIIFWL